MKAIFSRRIPLKDTQNSPGEALGPSPDLIPFAQHSLALGLQSLGAPGWV